MKGKKESPHTSKAPSPIRLPSEHRSSGKAHTLNSVVTELRKRSRELPLTIALHGWGQASSEAFLQELSPSLKEDDAVWMVRTKTRMHGYQPTIHQGAVLLKLEIETDRRILQNLVGHIFFFPCEEEEEADWAERFSSRTRVAIVDRRGLFSKQVLRGTCQDCPLLVVYLWSGDGTLIEGRRQTTQVLAPAAERVMPDFDEVGRNLKEQATNLEKDFYRRYRFRSCIQEVLNAIPGYPRWDEAFLRMANKYWWPAWAIQSLPRLYVPLERRSARRLTALAWHWLVKCIPKSMKYTILDELCEGEILEIEMTPKAADLVTEITRTIQENLRGSPYWSAGAFYGRIAAAFQQIEFSLREENPQAARGVQTVHQRFLLDTKIIAVQDR